MKKLGLAALTLLLAAGIMKSTPAQSHGFINFGMQKSADQRPEVRLSTGYEYESAKKDKDDKTCRFLTHVGLNYNKKESEREGYESATRNNAFDLTMELLPIGITDYFHMGLGAQARYHINSLDYEKDSPFPDKTKKGLYGVPLGIIDFHPKDERIGLKGYFGASFPMITSEKTEGVFEHDVTRWDWDNTKFTFATILYVRL